nr:DapH/DapD/GlmU-related protein [uncultured Porphyromonas sp.]
MDVPTAHYQAHPTAIIDEGCSIGSGTIIWHFSHVMQGATLGNNCSLGQNVVVSPGVILGDGCRVQNNVSIYTGVHCAENVFLGPSCVFTNILNPRAFISRKEEFLPTRIGCGASIGANATILCGISIGAYALVGAGTVVLSDVPDFALVVGNPARQIGWVSRYGERLNFDEKGRAQCPITQEVYQLSNSKVSLVE